MGDGRGDVEGRQQGPITLSLVNRRLEEHDQDVTRFRRPRTPSYSPSRSRPDLRRAPGVSRFLPVSQGTVPPHITDPRQSGPVPATRHVIDPEGERATGMSRSTMSSTPPAPQTRRRPADRYAARRSTLGSGFFTTGAASHGRGVTRQGTNAWACGPVHSRWPTSGAARCGDSRRSQTPHQYRADLAADEPFRIGLHMPRLVVTAAIRSPDEHPSRDGAPRVQGRSSGPEASPSGRAAAHWRAPRRCALKSGSA